MSQATREEQSSRYSDLVLSPAAAPPLPHRPHLCTSSLHSNLNTVTLSLLLIAGAVGYFPPEEENKYNAWYIKTEVKGNPEGGLLEGKRVALKVRRSVIHNPSVPFTAPRP